MPLDLDHEIDGKEFMEEAMYGSAASCPCAKGQRSGAETAS
jgi:hypothetical protein